MENELKAFNLVNTCMRPIHAALAMVSLLVLPGIGLAQNFNNFLRPYDVDAHTVVLYHVDDNVADGVGNHPGTLFGNAGFVSGHFGQALGLDGQGDYMSCGNVHQNPPRDLTQGTVELWFKLQSAPSKFVLAGAGQAYGGDWDDGFLLGADNDYSSNLVFMVWGSGWSVADSGVSPTTLIGAWHHVAGTWGPRGVEIWLDGHLVGTNAYTGGLPNPNYVTMLVGADSWTWCTPGSIDEIRVSDVQRTLITSGDLNCDGRVDFEDINPFVLALAIPPATMPRIQTATS